MNIRVEAASGREYHVTICTNDLSLMFEIAHRKGKKPSDLLADAIERGLIEFQGEHILKG